MAIHPTALVESDAQIGSNVDIGPFSYVANHVTLGDDCHLGPHVTILPHTTLGTGCQVHAGAVLGDLPQDLAFQPNTVSYVQIGQRCVLREGVTVHRGTHANTVTQVGDDCLLMANSHVGHNAVLGNRVILANGALVGGYASVGDRTFVSGNCMIHQLTRVGRLAMLSGGCAVQKDVPPFCMTCSSTSNTIMGLNVVGLRRAQIMADDRQALKRALKVLYRSNLTVSDAIAKLEQDVDSPLIQELCEFVRQSERGICKFSRRRSRFVEDDENP